MNRSQAQIVEFNRKHRLKLRVLTVAGVATLVAAALWSAGAPPSELAARAARWFADRVEQRRVPDLDVAPPPEIDATPLSVSATAPPLEGTGGTDDSLSAQPLPLYLLATKPGRNSREGTASLGTSLDNPQIYAAGAVLVNGAQLAEIYEDHVVLRRGEQQASLAIHSRGGVTNAGALHQLLTVGGEQPVPIQAQTEPSRALLTDYLRPSPVYEGTLIHGYQVYPGRRAGVFAQWGLQAGDVITAIDDAPFADPTQAMQTFEQLVAGSAMTATIERKTGTTRISLDGALVSEDAERALSASSATDLQR